ncbi:MAG: hypothetical protein NVS3B18_03090 [Candidatus Dormibacteria bacterium]
MTDQPGPEPRRPRPGRRRAIVALLVLTPFALVLSAGAGAAVALEQARQDGASRLAAGDYAGALGVYRGLAGRSGPLYLLDRQAIRDATRGEDRTLLAWAPALAEHGRVEQALRLLSEARASEVGTNRSRLRATLLLDGARAAAAGGDPLVALGRLDWLAKEAPPDDLARQAAALRPVYELASATTLLRVGRPAEAVAALDRVRSLPHTAQQDRQVEQLLPATLLAAGQTGQQRDDLRSAAAWLGRLVRVAPASAEARAARALLDAPQRVSGTLSRRDGSPVAGGVRLAGHFVHADRGDYATGPYFAAAATTGGDFRIEGVPVGGPYVIQVQRDGEWLTPVDTRSGEPAYSATVTPLTPVDLSFVIVPN